MMARQFRGRVSVLGPPITVGVVGLLLWEAVVRGFGIREFLLPRPTSIMHELNLIGMYFGEASRRINEDWKEDHGDYYGLVTKRAGDPEPGIEDGGKGHYGRGVDDHGKWCKSLFEGTKTRGHESQRYTGHDADQ